MSLGKKDIANQISSKTQISKETSKNLLNFFLSTITKKNLYKVKLSNFGTFYTKKTPLRYGRNPKTLESHLISERTVLKFKAANKIKNILN
jgi:integration host factor subunit alpha